MNYLERELYNEMFDKKNDIISTPEYLSYSKYKPLFSTNLYHNYVSNNKKHHTNSFRINRTHSIFSFHSNNNSPKKNLRKNSVVIRPKVKKISTTPVNKGYYSLISTESNTNTRKKKNCLSTVDRIKLKTILKNFKENKIITNELMSLDKRYPLNSVTESSYMFLFPKDQKKRKKNSNNKFLNINKSSMIPIKMIKKFNFKTKGLLDVDPNKEEGIKFSKNINEFRKQIINSYNDQIVPKDVKKGKINYNNALTFLEQNDENKIRKAEELEKEFYKVKYNENQVLIDEKLFNKSTINSKEKSSNNINQYNFDTDKNDESSSKKTSIKSNNTKTFLSSKNKNLFKNFVQQQLQRQQNPQGQINNPLNNINNTAIKINYESERILNDVKARHSKFQKKILKDRSREYANSLAAINGYSEYQPLQYSNSELPGANINEINLKRVIKVNSINKNLFAADDDDLLQHNIKKLKEEIRNVEIEYYTVDKKKQYKLSFVKNQVKPQTITKLNHMRNPHFGVPC